MSVDELFALMPEFSESSNSVFSVGTKRKSGKLMFSVGAAAESSRQVFSVGAAAESSRQVFSVGASDSGAKIEEDCLSQKTEKQSKPQQRPPKVAKDEDEYF